MEYIYADIIPFRQFSPCTSLLCMEKHGEIAQEQSFSSLQSNRGERSNIPSGALRTTPLLRMLYTFCLCHMVYGTTRKEYGILQTRHTDVSLDKADGVCRREVGTARLPAVTLPCLEGLITHIHSYLYYHIGVLTYCYIV